MPTDVPAAHRHAPRSLGWRGIGFLLLAMAMLAMPGCRGCQPETPAEQAAREAREDEARKKRLEEQAEGKKKEPKKPPLEVSLFAPQPNMTDPPLPLVKPGHWMTAQQTLKANYNNWAGDARLEVVGRNGESIALPRTEFALRSERDAAVAKGKSKAIETFFFTPPSGGQANRMLTAQMQYRGRMASASPATVPQPLTRMAPHQQHFIVVSDEPSRYGFLSSTYVVRARLPASYELSGTAGQFPFDYQYRVVAPTFDDRPPLPENPLCWTTVAYVLWDGADPELVTPAQRAALVDWLHWGGQLLVSGPDSLDALAGSFLDKYLPAENAGAVTLTADDLRPISGAWNVAKDRKPLEPASEWSGVKLKLRKSAQPIPGVGNLFAERRVGRGRVIVSAVHLAERDLINWSSGYENLLNNLLLRRPPREFKWDVNLALGNYDGEVTGGVYVAAARADTQGETEFIDAGQNTRLRYFARDTHGDNGALNYQVTTEKDGGGRQPMSGMGRGGGRFGGQFSGGFPTVQIAAPTAASGPAAWTDFSATANAARSVLREAAGVETPSARFVLICLSAYLLVLVPMNWFVFRALGRTELAWIAAPLIAIAGTLIVVERAQLDIGFVRAQSEVAILETQADHPRGHLTRFLAFYTSLSTTYDLEFDDATTIAAPFCRQLTTQIDPGVNPQIVTYERQERARLLGMPVSSNSTDMIHAEQMADLGGAIRLDEKGRQIVNETDFKLQSVGVVRRSRDGSLQLMGCWIGEVEPRSSAAVYFSPVDWTDESPPLEMQRLAENESYIKRTGNERVNLEPLFALALDPRQIEPGETRLVARIEQSLPGVNATPDASQLRGATLVVSHLEYGRLPTPVSDANAPKDAEGKGRG